MATRDVVSNPCEDACGTLRTDRTVEGAPVYLCPGCDTEWIDLDERSGPAVLHQAATQDGPPPR